MSSKTTGGRDLKVQFHCICCIIAVGTPRKHTGGHAAAEQLNGGVVSRVRRTMSRVRRTTTDRLLVWFTP